MRFISMPTTLDWYMKHIFPFQRNLLKAVRPIANRVAPFELPTDSYFANIRNLFEKLEGVDDLMEDPYTTSVRLVTNPEKMVLRETQRAFVYFSLHGLTVDAVIVNRLLPRDVTDALFNEWHTSQEKVLEEIEDISRPSRCGACRFSRTRCSEKSGCGSWPACCMMKAKTRPP